MKWQGRHLASGTGFIVMHNGCPFLITNRHNLAGRSSETNKLLFSHGVEPDEVHILHHRVGPTGRWVLRSEALVDELGKPARLEHPAGGSQIDFVARRLAGQLAPNSTRIPSMILAMRAWTHFSCLRWGQHRWLPLRGGLVRWDRPLGPRYNFVRTGVGLRGVAEVSRCQPQASRPVWISSHLLFARWSGPAEKWR